MPLPILFNKALSSTELLLAYNNHIVEFYSQNQDGVVDSLRCEITIIEGFKGAVPYVITPDKDNIFYFNFREAFIQVINQNDFDEEIVLDINTGDKESLTIVDDAFSFKRVTIEYKIVFVDLSEEINRPFAYIMKGVEQESNYIASASLNRKLDTAHTDFYLLTPFAARADRKVYLTWFKGFPFDVGFFKETTGNLTITQGASNETVSFPKYTGRLLMSDGFHHIETFVAIDIGENTITFNSTSTMTLMLTKKQNICGVYLKWINMYGKWNYWLFNQKDKRQLVTKDSKDIFNDFSNVGENRSPYLSTGKQSKEVVSLHCQGVTENEMYYLKHLFESPKVFLWTGEENDEDDANLWLEVKLKGKTQAIKNYKRNQFNISCKIELPQRTTMTL